MPRRASKARSHCPIQFALEIFGDRWTLLIVRDLMFYGKKTYGEFLSAEEGISTNVLADRLSRLEATGIVTKEIDPGQKARFLYRLTGKGEDLLPVLLEIIAWSSTHDPKTAAPRDFARKLHSSRERVMAQYRRAFKERETRT
jgi:DNA-binding HxlR family transcriptional regulator